MSNSKIHHPVLGILQYDDELDYYQGQVTLDKLDIELALETDDDCCFEPALKRALNIFPQLSYYINSAKQYAVEKLIKLKNETWCDDEESVSLEEFKNRITLESITFVSDGDVKFYYDDADLLFGHPIVVRMDVNNQFTNASI